MSPKTLLSRIILLITVCALVACTTSTVPQTPTAAPNPPAEPTAATIPSTYHGVALPGAAARSAGTPRLPHG